MRQETTNTKKHRKPKNTNKNTNNKEKNKKHTKQKKTKQQTKQTKNKQQIQLYTIIMAQDVATCPVGYNGADYDCAHKV